MSEPDQIEEENIWNYKRTGSRKRECGRSNSRTLRSKRKRNADGEKTENVSPQAELQDNAVIDVDLEDDFPFTNMKPASNDLSIKKWSSMLSRTNNSADAGSQKKKNNKGQKKRLGIPPKSPISKQMKKKDNRNGQDHNECERGINRKSLGDFFSPQKLTPEKTGGLDLFNHETENSSSSSDSEQNSQPVECRNLVATGKSKELTDDSEEKISGSSQEDYQCLSSFIIQDTDGKSRSEGEDSSAVNELGSRTEAKVVDVIVIGEDTDDTDTLSENDFDKTRVLSVCNSQMCDDDSESAGGFLINDSESDEDTKLDKEIKCHLSDSAPLNDINSKDESPEESGSHPLLSDEGGDNRTDSDYSKSSIFPSSAVARKQTSLFSFFSSKSSLISSSISKGTSDQRFNSKKTDGAPPFLPKAGTFPPGGKQPKSSGNAADISKAYTGNSSHRGRQRECPFYKKMPGTNITVDAFRYGTIPGCSAYFLTHFHYDHYGGLTKKFAHPIYCSEVTGNLVESRLGVDKKWVRRLPMWKPVTVDGVTLTLMEANHCPGAVIVLFEMSDGKKILHTGDFRASVEMEEYPALKNVVVDELYLDTTYCNPSYAFPSQRTVIDFAVSLVEKQIALNPKTLIVCGAYTIGKEKIFSAIAEALDSKICVMSDKKKVLDCLDDKDLKKRLTLKWSEGQVHVLPMAKLKQEPLFEHHSRHPHYTSVLAFEPTGWTHSQKAVSLQNLKPKWSGNGVTLYGIPYSEHSSFLELKRFVQFTRPKKILPTVNNGSPAARQKMEALFKQWLNEKVSQGGNDDVVPSQQSKLENWMKD